MRNTHLLAIAPTVSNSRINACSAGIEPQPANVYVFNGAKGTFIVKNPELEKLLESKGKNNSKVWDQILADNGSVQNLSNDILHLKKTDNKVQGSLTATEVVSEVRPIQRERWVEKDGEYYVIVSRTTISAYDYKRIRNANK